MKYIHLIDRDDAESKHTIITTHDYILFYCFVKLDVLCLALCFIQDVDRVFFIKSSIKIDEFRKRKKGRRQIRFFRLKKKKKTNEQIYPIFREESKKKKNNYIKLIIKIIELSRWDTFSRIK